MEKESPKVEGHERDLPLVMPPATRAADGPQIRSIPAVCGGQACIAHTRIPVYLLEEYRRLGKSNSDLLDMYPVLTASDLQAAWTYVAQHQDEIDAQIARD